MTALFDPVRRFVIRLLARRRGEVRANQDFRFAGEVARLAGVFAVTMLLPIAFLAFLALTSIRWEELSLDAGATKKVPFSASIPLGTPEGELQVEAELVPEGGSEPVGAGSAPLAVGEKPRVLVLTAEPQDAELVATALRAEAMQIDVRTLDGKDFPKQIDKDTDLVLIVNAPAASVSSQRGMSEELLASLAKWVDEGGG